MDLALREPPDEMYATDLRPLLHPDHPGPPELALRKQAQAPRPTPSPQGGPLFNRLRWPSFHPAPTAVALDRLVAFKWPESCRRMSTIENAPLREPAYLQAFPAGWEDPYNASHARGRWFETSRAH